MANKPYALVPFKYLEDNFIKKGADTSWVGYRIMDENLDTQAKVIEKLGGTYWKLLSNSLGVYQWLRTDSPTPRSAYLGYSFITTKNITSDSLSDIFGGVNWEEISNEDGVHQWVCKDYTGGTEEILPAYVGMIISSPNLPDATSVQEKYGGTWTLLGNEDGVYQWYCSAHTSEADHIDSQVGEVIASGTLIDATQVATKYDGTWELLSDEDDVFQWERVS